MNTPSEWDWQTAAGLCRDHTHERYSEGNCPSCQNIAQALDAANAEGARKALASASRFMQHAPGCPVLIPGRMFTSQGPQPRPCTCGLSDLRACAVGLKELHG